jgi:hypothetical protein
MTAHDRHDQSHELRRQPAALIRRTVTAVRPAEADLTHWAHLRPGQILALQRLTGNAVVTALLQAGATEAALRRGPASAEPATRLQRQMATGRYGLNAEGRLREDDDSYTEKATLPRGTAISVLDKGTRASLFKAGWFSTNEHSWSQAASGQVGWIDDGKLDHYLGHKLGEALAKGKPSLDQLLLLIDSATTEEKKKAADDDAFLAKARSALDEDTYLALLPALGVHRQPTKPQLSQGGAAHTTGPEPDKVIRQHLQQYVADAVRAGRKVEGEVSVVGDEDFQKAFDRQWVRAAGQRFPGKKAKEVCNAFVDVNLTKRHIWVHRDMGDTGTVIHEGMHKYADATLRDGQIAMCKRLRIPYGGISQLDEGITEYFTRVVVAQLPLPQRVNYENQFQVATKLVATYTEQVVAAAYYDGKFDALQIAVGINEWPQFAEALEKKDWSWLSKNGYM